MTSIRLTEGHSAECTREKIMLNFLHYSVLKLNPLIFVVFALAISSPVSAAFVISGEEGCYSGQKIYAYHFTEFSAFPTYTVQVNGTTISPNITIQLVRDPKIADLVFVDALSIAEMKVCKTNNPFGTGAKTIVVKDVAFSPDITVRLTEYSLSPDYKMYVDSKNFSREEVAAVFAVIWAERRKSKTKE